VLIPLRLGWVVEGPPVSDIIVGSLPLIHQTTRETSLYKPEVQRTKLKIFEFSYYKSAVFSKATRSGQEIFQSSQ